MITGAVLAGGTSSRFGSEKAVAQLGPCSMMSHVVAVLNEVCDEVLVAVAPARGKQYRAMLGNEVRVVEDPVANQGPIRGLVTALEAAAGEYVVVSPCDTPLLHKGVCESIAERAEGRDGAVPMVNGYLEPLHAAYGREACRKAFIDVMKRGSRRPRDAFPLLDLAIVEESSLRKIDPDLVSFINVNSEDVLELAANRLGLK